MQKVLITGGAGFIGSNLASRLVNMGYRVTVIDSLSEQVHGKIPEITSPLYASIFDKVDFIHGDVNDTPDLANILSDHEIVVHLAAETGTGQSMYQVSRYSVTNVVATAKLLDILASGNHRVKKVLLASTRAVYGEGKYLSPECGVVFPASRSAEYMAKGDFEVKHPGCTLPLKVLPTDEDSMLHPSSVYGITKLSQEQLTITVCKAVGIPYTVFRLQNVYGPGQSLTNPYTGILSIFSNQIKNRKTINIFEDGKESRDFVFIDDVVDAMLLGVMNETANNEVFNVGTGMSTNVLTVAKQLMRCYEINVPMVVSGNYRVGDIRHNVADVSRIKSRLRFAPKVSFEIGIERFAAWVNEQSVEENNYAESIQEMRLKGLLKELEP